MPLGKELLEKLLKEFGIPTQEWGRGEARTLDDFLQEISRGESYVRIDGDGIFRAVEIVKMFILRESSSQQGFLLEWGQYLPDQRYRERKQHPSGKIKRGESPQEALWREAAEELGITQSHVCQLSTLLPKFEQRPSMSYPGLTCLYTVHGFYMTLASGAPVCQEEEFTITESDGTRHIFKWVK